MSLARFLDEDQQPEIRDHVTRLTSARFVSNVCVRFAQPYLGVIGRSLGVGLGSMGLATSLGEFTGLLGPFVGHHIARRSRRLFMALALCLMAVGTALAGVAPSVTVISVAFILLTFGKVVFDNAMSAWTVERTHHDTRGQVVGLTEIAWGGAILLGVPILAVVVYLSSWRLAYGVATAMVLLMAFHLWRRLPRDKPDVAVDEPRIKPEWTRPAICGFLAFGMLMGTGMCLFVSFGSWFKDVHGYSTLGIGALSIVLGAVEVLAATTTMRFADRWGKRRSVRLGAAVMIPPALALTAVGHHSIVGIALLAVFFLGFEFSIVTFVSLVPTLQPAAPVTAFGIAIGFGTLGRGLTAIASTRLYTAHGIGGSTVLAAALAAGALLALTGVSEPARTTLRPAPAPPA